MAKRVEGVTEKLLECAKEEFLRCGYESASLRSIAEKAGSSKGAIYIRYPDKENLYLALIQPVTDEFCHLLETALAGFEALPGPEQAARLYTYADASAGFSQIVDYIYDHFSDFKLLLCSGEGKAAQAFIHRIVELDTHSTLRFIEQTSNDAISAGRLTPDLAHMLSSAFYSALFEIVIHDMPKEEALEHIHRIRRFYNAGWKTIFAGNDP